jgi:dienelactone hydrolase
MPTLETEIEIAVDGERIAGTFITPATTVPGVLCVHGWAGSQEQYLSRARSMAALGCVSLPFDMRGHARTEAQSETVTREQNLRDVLAAYDELVRHPGVDRDAIAVVGSSYGGYLSAILTTLRPVKWLALRVPALYQDSDWDVPKTELHRRVDLAAYRRRRVAAHENRALRACAEFRGDVLIVESENDETVPHRTIENYVEACTHAHSLTYRVIQDADHALSDEASQRAYTDVLVNWITEMVFGARSGGGRVSAARASMSVPAHASHPG